MRSMRPAPNTGDCSQPGSTLCGLRRAAQRVQELEHLHATLAGKLLAVSGPAAHRKHVFCERPVRSVAALFFALP